MNNRGFKTITGFSFLLYLITLLLHKKVRKSLEQTVDFKGPQTRKDES